MADRATWERVLATARRRWPRANLRVTLLDPSVALAFVATALVITRSGPGVDEVGCAFGRTDVEALDELEKELNGKADSR